MSLQAAFLMLSPCTRTWSTITLYISSATNEPWPHPLHLSFLVLFLFVSHYQDSFPKTHNHLCSCSYHPEIMTCVTSVLLLNVHTGINVCYLSLFCDSWGSYIVCLSLLNENMVKLVQNYFCLESCRKHWANWNVCENRWNVKRFKKRVFVSRTVWKVWKIVSNESVIVC